MWNVECKGTERTECGGGMEIYKKRGESWEGMESEGEKEFPFLTWL